MPKRLLPFLVLLTLLSNTIVGCAPRPAAATTGRAATGPAATLPAAAESPTTGERGAEATLVSWSDSRQGFSLSYPGTWTQDASFTPGVRFAGVDSSMQLQLVSRPVGMNAMTFAEKDVAAVAGAFPGFQKIALAVSTEVMNAVVLAFQAAGKSAVTGKPFVLRADRYYMPLADGRVAVLTFAGPESHYDREGVRDIALTFKIAR